MSGRWIIWETTLVAKAHTRVHPFLPFLFIFSSLSGLAPETLSSFQLTIAPPSCKEIVGKAKSSRAKGTAF